MYSHEDRLNSKNEWNFIRLPMGAHLISIGDFLDISEVLRSYAQKEESSSLVKAPEEGQAPASDRNTTTSREG